MKTHPRRTAIFQIRIQEVRGFSPRRSPATIIAWISSLSTSAVTRLPRISQPTTSPCTFGRCFPVSTPAAGTAPGGTCAVFPPYRQTVPSRAARLPPSFPLMPSRLKPAPFVTAAISSRRPTHSSKSTAVSCPNKIPSSPLPLPPVYFSRPDILSIQETSAAIAAAAVCSQPSASSACCPAVRAGMFSSAARIFCICPPSDRRRASCVIWSLCGWYNSAALSASRSSPVVSPPVQSKCRARSSAPPPASADSCFESHPPVPNRPLEMSLQIPPVHETRRMQCPRQDRILYLFQHLQFRVRLRTLHPSPRALSIPRSNPSMPEAVQKHPCILFSRSRPVKRITPSIPPASLSSASTTPRTSGYSSSVRNRAASRRTVQRQIVALPPIF